MFGDKSSPCEANFAVQHIQDWITEIDGQLLLQLTSVTYLLIFTLPAKVKWNPWLWIRRSLPLWLKGDFQSESGSRHHMFIHMSPHACSAFRGCTKSRSRFVHYGPSSLPSPPQESSPHLYGDNGSNFVGAERGLWEELERMDQGQVANQLSACGVEWHFNPPGVPWFGGAWEALFKSTKCAMRVMLGNVPTVDEVFCTVIA